MKPVDRHLLVLDLDETLLFACEHALDRRHDHRIGPYFVYWRPGLQRFLANMSMHFELAVWTSSSPAYAQGVCAEIFRDRAAPMFVWASDRCTLKRDLESDSWLHHKHLSKLRRRGHDLRRVVMVDDSPEKHRRNYGNLVPVSPYFGNEHDDELDWLARYLPTLVLVDDVRLVEKRGWRARLEARETPT